MTVRDMGTRAVLSQAELAERDAAIDSALSNVTVAPPILHEMIHESRVIPLDGRAHVSDAIRSYMGDPRGHWEGDTLVVETTNFNGKTGSYGRNGDGNPTSLALRLVERFRLTDATTLRYEVRVDDPQTFVRPWTVAFPCSVMRATSSTSTPAMKGTTPWRTS